MVGLLLGGVTALVASLFVIVSPTLHLFIPPARAGLEAIATWLVSIERRRLVRYFDLDEPPTAVPGWARASQYLRRRVLLGLVCDAIFLIIAVGMGTAAVVVWQSVTGQPIGGGEGEPHWLNFFYVSWLGSVLAFVAACGLYGVAVLDRALARHYLLPSEEELLRERVSELATSRAAVVAAVNDERRRIERDLHDGVQQRLVALGLLLGRARRAADPVRAGELLGQAHEEAQEALRDLREVTWRVYPTALDQGGLRTALEGVAERSSVPVQLRYGLPPGLDLDLPTETVAYFVASEAVTNALKHARPSKIEMEVTEEDGQVSVSVRDDGCGGADPGGSGLSGLASRVAAADGVFTVDSPEGGPTSVRARLPLVVAVAV